MCEVGTSSSPLREPQFLTALVNMLARTVAIALIIRVVCHLRQFKYRKWW